MRSSSSLSSSSSQKSKNKHKKTQLNTKPIKQDSFLLKELIKTINESLSDHRNLFKLKKYTKLTLDIIQKNPVYVSDGQASIMAIFKPQSDKSFPLNPFNRAPNQFYATHSKPHLIFNCRDTSAAAQIPLFPYPYHPAFYVYKYEQFISKTKSMKFSLSCVKIQVTCWSIGIVNISLSGYYAPILLIHQHRKINGNSLIQKPVQNILFYPQLPPLLEKFRINDMRKLSNPNTSQKLSSSSLSYHMRNKSPNLKSSPFINLDINNIFFKTNKSQHINFVPIGNLSQCCLFNKQINPKFISNKQFMNLSKYKLEPTKDIQQLNLNQLSSLDSLCQQRDQYQTRRNYQTQRPQQPTGDHENQNYALIHHQNYMISSESQSDSDEQDYLKNLYTRKLQENTETMI